MIFDNLTFNNYKDKINDKDTLYLIKFYSDECQPCKAMEPILEKVKLHFDNKLKYYQVDVDNEPKLSQVFEAYCTPFLVFYKNNNILKTLNGYKQSQELINLIENFLN